MLMVYWLDAASFIKTSHLTAPEFEGSQKLCITKSHLYYYFLPLIPRPLKELVFKSGCFYYLLINSFPVVYDQIKTHINQMGQLNELQWCRRFRCSGTKSKYEQRI